MSHRYNHRAPVQQHPGAPDCDFSDLKSGYLGKALDGISHYHLAHTSDVVTRFVTETVDATPPLIIHIYVCTEPAARKAFAEAGERFGMKPIPSNFQ